jgi:hypothetical protein
MGGPLGLLSLCSEMSHQRRLVQASEAAKQAGADWTGFGRPMPAGRTETVVQLALALHFRRLQQSRQEDRPNGFLNRLKRRPAVGHDALEVLPLLLE